MIQHLSPWGRLVAAVLLGLVVLVGPLPFGSVLPRERLALAAASLLALVLVASKDSAAALGRAAVPALALAGVGCFGLVQSVPWPSFVAELLTPRGARAWQTARELLGDGPSGGVPLTLSSDVSRETALLWLALAAALAAAAVVGGERRLRRGLGLALFAVAVFQIVYGVQHYFAQHPVIWGRTLVAGGQRLRGTFVNPDHFAMFLILPLTAAFAWGWWSLRRARERDVLERRLLHVSLPWLFFLLFFVGLAFTGSRAGLVGALVALGVQVGLLMAHYRKWQAGLVGLLALGVAAGGLLVFGVEQGLARWSTTSAYEITWNTRLVVWARGFELWRQFPWTGTGLGTFRQAFPLVQPPELGLTWFHAHSDALELLVTTGLVGVALVVLGLTALGKTLWHGLGDGRRSEDRATALAGWGALAGVAAHSLVDFGLTMPANAFTLAIVVGMACGVPTPRQSRRRGSRNVVLPPSVPPRGRSAKNFASDPSP